MGTSASYSGPNARNPLVPPWADVDGEGPGPEPEARRFQTFRNKIRSYSTTRDTDKLREALGAYSRTSLGGDGGRTAARRAAPATRTGGRLLGGLADIAAGGVGSQAFGFNVRNLAGQPVEVVLAQLVDALAPVDADPDAAATRNALSEALARVFDAHSDFDPEALSLEMLSDLLQTYVCETVFQRIIMDAGGSFSDDDPEQQVAMENNLRDFIDGAVDHVASQQIRESATQLTASDFEKLMSDTISAVFAEFEGFDQ